MIAVGILAALTVRFITLSCDDNVDGVVDEGDTKPVTSQNPKNFVDVSYVARVAHIIESVDGVCDGFTAVGIVMDCWPHHEVVV